MVADTESPSRTGPVATIIERLQRVKAIPGGYLASCPVPSHGKGKGDRHPSLSISEGDDGRALVSCHAGCTIHDVLSAIGLKPADLFPDTGNASGRIDMRKRRTTEPRVRDVENLDVVRVRRARGGQQARQGQQQGNEQCAE